MMPPADAAVSGIASLARLCAGGRHCRMLLCGRPPIGLVLPDLTGFDRVAWVSRPHEPAPGTIVADPLRLPFQEALFDRALVSGSLPAPDAQASLRELWRVLAPAALALLVIRARRPWQWQAPGWTKDRLKSALDAAMFDVIDWQIETLPQRHHLILVEKHDGLRPAMIGKVVAEVVPVTV